MTGKGAFFLTSNRVVFLREGRVPEGEWTSFDIPLSLMQNPHFRQPIFGANYLDGHVAPKVTAPNPIAGTAYWSLTFNKGGCGTFLPIFYRILGETNQPGTQSQFIQGAQAGQLSQMAYVDPNDPSVLYITQPQPIPQQAMMGYQGTATAPPPP